MAPPETDSDSRAITRENLRIVFLYPYGGDCESESFTASAADCSDNSAGKCGQICGGGLPKLRSSKANSEETVTSWHYTLFCRIDAHDDLAQARIYSVSGIASASRAKNTPASICLACEKCSAAG